MPKRLARTTRSRLMGLADFIEDNKLVIYFAFKFVGKQATFDTCFGYTARTRGHRCYRSLRDLP